MRLISFSTIFLSYLHSFSHSFLCTHLKAGMWLLMFRTSCPSVECPVLSANRPPPPLGTVTSFLPSLPPLPPPPPAATVGPPLPASPAPPVAPSAPPAATVGSLESGKRMCVSKVNHGSTRKNAGVPHTFHNDSLTSTAKRHSFRGCHFSAPLLPPSSCYPPPLSKLPLPLKPLLIPHPRLLALLPHITSL